MLEPAQKTGLCLALRLVLSSSPLKRDPDSFCPFVICAKAGCTSWRKISQRALHLLRLASAKCGASRWCRFGLLCAGFALSLGQEVFPHQKHLSLKQNTASSRNSHMNPRLLASCQEKIAWLFSFWLSLCSWGSHKVYLSLGKKSKLLSAVLPGQGQNWAWHWLGSVAACLQLSSPISEHSNDSSLCPPFLLPSFFLSYITRFSLPPFFLLPACFEEPNGKGVWNTWYPMPMKTKCNVLIHR